MSLSRMPALSGAAMVGVSLVLLLACGSETPRRDFPKGGPGTHDPSNPSGDFVSDRPCEGLACQQVDCGPEATTSLTGIVTAPNGTLPLYNVIVYVPNAPLEPIPSGASCDRCGTVSGEPLVSTVSGIDGSFTLTNVPVGEDIPLVIQVGKWRRQVTLPKVEACTQNAASQVLTRLPKNASEGDLPHIAVTTGRCDQLACLLPKLGLDASEFTVSDGPGHLHLYRGAAHPTSAPVPAPAPAGSLDATQLFSGGVSALSKYDMLMLSCECGEHEETKSPEAKDALYEFTTRGGRVFASHFHYTWADRGPLSRTAQWIGSPENPENPPGPYLIDTSFPKGDAFSQWLVAVDASTVPGQMPISQPRENVGRITAPTQRWVYRQTGEFFMPQSTKYLSVNTPVGQPIAEQCGKFVFADMHLYGGDVQPPVGALPDDGFPGTCSPDLTPEEKALAFLFFDLSACIQDDGQAPEAPR